MTSCKLFTNLICFNYKLSKEVIACCSHASKYSVRHSSSLLALNFLVIFVANSFRFMEMLVDLSLLLCYLRAMDFSTEFAHYFVYINNSFLIFTLALNSAKMLTHCFC